MDSGVSAATNGLTAYLRAQEVLAHNLANVNTPGFRRRMAVFHSFDEALAQAQGESESPVDVVVDFRHGPMRETGNPLDLTLGADGFFVLGADEGYLYTRKGNFSLSADGAVVDSLGRPLIGRGGARLRVPADAREIRVDPSGEVFADNTSVGRVWVVEPVDTAQLVPAPYTAFSLPETAPPPTTVREPDLVQGAIEGSNTDPVEEMVNMIATLRSFEAAQRVLRSMSDTTEQMATAASRPA